MSIREPDEMDQLPHRGLDAEKGVLGCCLLDSVNAIPACAEKCPVESFVDPIHQSIAVELYAMHREGAAIDIITVSNRMGATPQPGSAGWMAYLSGLQDFVPSASNITYYADIVWEESRRRKFVVMAIDFKNQAFNATDMDAVLVDADKRIKVLICGTQAAGEGESLADIGREAIAAWEDAASGKPRNGIPFLLPGLGHLIDWADGYRFIVIGARPSVGKSSVLLHIADEAAIKGYPVGLISMEMPKREVYERLISRETGVPYKRISKSDTTEREKEKIVAAVTRTNGRPIHIVAKALTYPQLESETRRLIHQRGIRALFIDYLGLIRKTGKSPLYEHITEVSQSLKGIAMRHEIPVICAAQLNRETENAAREPQLSDFRDSGSIEQDADIVLLLSEKSNRPTELTVNVAKQRGGERGKVQVRFERSTCQFGFPV